MIYLPLVWYVEHFGPEPILQRRRRLKVASTDSSWWLQASCPTRTCCNQAADNDDILLVSLKAIHCLHLNSPIWSQAPKPSSDAPARFAFVGLLLPETSPTIAYNQWLVNIEYCGCTQQCFCSPFIRVSHTKTHRTPQHSVRIDFPLILRPCSFLTVSVYLCWCWCRRLQEYAQHKDYYENNESCPLSDGCVLPFFCCPDPRLKSKWRASPFSRAFGLEPHKRAPKKDTPDTCSGRPFCYLITVTEFWLLKPCPMACLPLKEGQESKACPWLIAYDHGINEVVKCIDSNQLMSV